VAPAGSVLAGSSLALKERRNSNARFGAFTLSIGTRNNNL
jgi:hypothetical protein